MTPRLERLALHIFLCLRCAIAAGLTDGTKKPGIRLMFGEPCRRCGKEIA